MFPFPAKASQMGVYSRQQMRGDLADFWFELRQPLCSCPIRSASNL
jgi:hypothetical protein